MTSPRRYSTSPLPSYATRLEFVARPVSLADMIREIIESWRGRKLTMRERHLEEKLVTRLAAEMIEDESKDRA